MKEKPTLRTLASETGLAVATVSRALNNAPEIAEATKRRVRDAADRLGYKPDRAAQRLKTGKTKVIAFVLEPHEEMLAFGTRMIAGITSVLRDTDYHLVVIPQFRETEPIESIRQIVRNRNADGVIFCRTRPFDERVKYLLQEQFPFVTHGRTELATPHPFVDFDNFEFACRATRILVEEGRKKVALIGAPREYTYSHHLLHGFMTAVRESGVAYEVADPVHITSPQDEIRAWVSEAVTQRGVDGIVCGGESSLLATLSGLSASGLMPEKDVGVAFKQTTPLFDQISNKVHVIYEDLESAGRKLGQTLLAQLRETGETGLDPIEKPLDVCPPLP